MGGMGRERKRVISSDSGSAKTGQVREGKPMRAVRIHPKRHVRPGNVADAARDAQRGRAGAAAFGENLTRTTQEHP